MAQVIIWLLHLVRFEASKKWLMEADGRIVATKQINEEVGITRVRPK